MESILFLKKYKKIATVLSDKNYSQEQQIFVKWAMLNLVCDTGISGDDKYIGQQDSCLKH